MRGVIVPALKRISFIIIAPKMKVKEFRVRSSEFEVQSSEFKVQASEFRSGSPV